MSTRDRARRFVHPDLTLDGEPGPDVEPAGLEISPRGTIGMVEGDDAARQAVLLLISTVPGERVVRPDDGCDLHRLVFSPNDDTTAGLAIYDVRRALERWEPRAQIVRLDAQPNPGVPEWLDLILDYRVRETRQTASLRLSYNLAGVGA